MFMLVYRLYGLAVQGPFPPATVPEAGRRRAVVPQRAQPRLLRYLPDSQRLTALHAALRHAAARLQRPPLRVRRRARHRTT